MIFGVLLIRNYVKFSFVISLEFHIILVWSKYSCLNENLYRFIEIIFGKEKFEKTINSQSESENQQYLSHTHGSKVNYEFFLFAKQNKKHLMEML